MERIEFLVEEKSIAEILFVLLPKILPTNWNLNQNYFIRSFEGKSDLAKSIPKKSKIYGNLPNTGIVIIHDQDSADCKQLKNKLIKLAKDNGNSRLLVRIVCRELESWYLGDFIAIQHAYPDFKAENYINLSKFRSPDKLVNASEELQKILPVYQKISSAKKISHFLNIEQNKSESFNQFIAGIKRFVN